MIDKNELKKKYKETALPMGIYCVKNLANGKVFIGKSQNLNGKLNSLKFQLEHGSSVVKELQSDFNKFGAASFEFKILDLLEPKDGANNNYDEELKVLEQMWLDNLEPFNEKGYNTKRIKHL